MMNKRIYEDSENVSAGGNVYEASRISKKFKNSLDSDEDDDENEAEKQNVYDPDDLEGQEESTIDHDGEIKITPFNMKDELEEGHFDRDGTFIFDRNKDEIKDQWLDDIDWVKVKSGPICPKSKIYSSDSEDMPELDVISHYKKMLELMEPSETVQAAICRLGGSNKSKKKKKTEVTEAVKKEQIEKMQLLTGYAGDIIQNGDMDIYQQTYERLSYLVKTDENKKSSAIFREDRIGDMFGETFEENIQEKEQKSDESSVDEIVESSLMWEFKWQDHDSSPVYGPHSTTEMLHWVQEGYFSDGVYVRKVGNLDSQFYTSKRIDFELYL